MCILHIYRRIFFIILREFVYFNWVLLIKINLNLYVFLHCNYNNFALFLNFSIARFQVTMRGINENHYKLYNVTCLACIEVIISPTTRTPKLKLKNSNLYCVQVVLFGKHYMLIPDPTLTQFAGVYYIGCEQISFSNYLWWTQYLM